MDKLKENLFGIGAGAVGVVLLALIYFLILEPLSSLSAIQSEVESQANTLTGLARRQPIPIQEVRDELEWRRSANQDALRRALGFYEQQAATFNTLFPGLGDPPALNVFIGQYNDQIDTLVKSYQEKFKIQVDPAQPDLIFPKISKIEAIDPGLIPLAQKEFWIIQAIFEACNALDVAGLKEIEFPGRLSGAASRDARQYRKYHDVTVKIETRLSRLENLLTAIYASRTVPFVLEELTVKKTPEMVQKYLELVRTQKFDQPQDAQRADYEALIPEPSVLVELKLEAMEWQSPADRLGLAEPSPEETRGGTGGRE